jgi:DNA polymerase-3 subunit delta'
MMPEMGEPDRAALASLAEGSIGRALTLAGEGGIELGREIDALFAALPRIDPEKLHRFADSVSRPGADQAWRTASSLLRWRLSRAVADAARGRTTELSRRLVALAPLDRWIEVWDKVSRLVAQADGLNLDRRQAVLGAFFAMERAARA